MYSKCLCTVNLIGDKLSKFIIYSSRKLENLLCAMHCAESQGNKEKEGEVLAFKELRV